MYHPICGRPICEQNLICGQFFRAIKINSNEEKLKNDYIKFEKRKFERIL